uniref:Bestrophin homolog n=1 Tax=Haemonchus placei TaxID=6290 RepID=A0A0N4X967_HAEPC
LEHMDQLPFKSTLTVILGFTALTCVQRWMDVYNLLVWPENVALMFNSWFRDEAVAPEEARIIRHSVYRYLLLTYILLLRDVSIPIKKQFPTYQHLIQGKLLTKEELELMESSNIDPNYCRYWMPLLWICQLVKKYYKCLILVSIPLKVHELSALPSNSATHKLLGIPNHMGRHSIASVGLRGVHDAYQPMKLLCDKKHASIPPSLESNTPLSSPQMGGAGMRPISAADQ